MATSYKSLKTMGIMRKRTDDKDNDNGDGDGKDNNVAALADC